MITNGGDLRFLNDHIQYFTMTLCIYRNSRTIENVACDRAKVE